MPTLRIAAIGFFVGLTVSITSIGAGSLTLPLLILVAPSIALRGLVGTDVAFAIVVPRPVAARPSEDRRREPAAGGLVVVRDRFRGVFVGSHLVTRLPERWFRGALAGVLVVVAFLLLPIHLPAL